MQIRKSVPYYKNNYLPAYGKPIWPMDGLLKCVAKPLEKRGGYTNE
ncbi:hypothetical protein PAAL109150_14200 [Paenibacillus alkaliterrae]